MMVLLFTKIAASVPIGTVVNGELIKEGPCAFKAAF